MTAIREAERIERKRITALREAERKREPRPKPRVPRHEPHVFPHLLDPHAPPVSPPPGPAYRFRTQPFVWDGIWLRRDQLLRLGYRPGEPYQIDGVWYWPIICPAALVPPGDICGGFRTRQ